MYDIGKINSTTQTAPSTQSPTRPSAVLLKLICSSLRFCLTM